MDQIILNQFSTGSDRQFTLEPPMIHNWLNSNILGLKTLEIAFKRPFMCEKVARAQKKILRVFNGSCDPG